MYSNDKESWKDKNFFVTPSCGILFWLQANFVYVENMQQKTHEKF